MKFKSTWIVIAVFLALGAYLFFVEEPSHRARQEAEQREGLLFPDLDTESATALTLETRGGTVQVVKEENNRWRVVEPVKDAADDGKVRSLVSDLAELKTKREVAGPEAELTSFGLQEPEGIVKLDGHDALAIGSLNPAGDARYVRVGNGPVEIADQGAVEAFLVDADDLRSRNVLVEFPWEDLDRVEIQPAGGEALRLVRREGAWQIEAPIEAEADQGKAKELAEKLRWARITGFPDSEAENAGQKLADATTVVLAAGEGAPVTVRLAQAEGATWGESSERNGVFSLNADVFGAFQVTADALRRKKPLRVQWRQLDRVAFQRGGAGTVYEKSDDLWNRGGKRVEGEEFTALTGVLELLETGTADRVIDGADPAEYGLDQPELTLDVEDTQGATQSVLLARTESGVYARGAEGGPVYQMSQDYLEKIDALLRVAARDGEAESAGASEGKTE